MGCGGASCRTCEGLLIDAPVDDTSLMDVEGSSLTVDGVDDVDGVNDIAAVVVVVVVPSLEPPMDFSLATVVFILDIDGKKLAFALSVCLTETTTTP